MPWQIETVHGPPWFEDMTQRSVAIHADGHPRIAFGGDHLYFAYYDGASWQVETVDDSDGVGSHASLALEGGGIARIAYHDAVNGSLKYAREFCDGYTCWWTTETVESTGNVGQYTSLALDDDNHPHIAYYQDGLGNLCYAYYDGSSWHTTLVDTLEDVGQYCSLALDSNDNPHISYYDATNGYLMYTYYDGAGWQFRTVDSSADVGQYSSLALDTSNQPHISYYDADNHDLKYARYTGVWVRETVDGLGLLGIFGHYTSIALDSSDHPHISYRYSNIGVSDLKYAYHDGSAWHRETVPGTGGHYTSLALNGGHPHISHVGGNDLLRSYHDGITWHTQTVDTRALVGQHTSLVAALSGRVSYYDVTNRNLMYAIRFCLVSGACFWLPATVDNSASVGQYSSLALDSGNNSRISYYDSSSGDLIYAFYVGGGGNCGPSNDWQCIPAAINGDVGMYASLALDSGDHPHFSYYDDTDDDLEYAYWDSAWYYRTVDSDGDVGQYTSLALDSSGNPHISYYDSTNGQLKYAYYDGSTGNCGPSNSWHCEVVDNDGDVGQHTSLALDSNENPHISYYDVALTKLKYAYYDGSSWHVQVVDDWGNSGKYNSLALDANDLPHISYYGDRGNMGEGDLVYAFYVGAGGNCVPGDAWQCITVDSHGDVGLYTSLYLDANDVPHISYYDATAGDLMYAWWQLRMTYLPLVTKDW